MVRTTTTAKLAKKRAVTPQPDWQSPHKPQPPEAINQVRPNIMMEAQTLAGFNAAPEVLAAIIIAQAADRLCKAMIEAAAVGRYRGA